MDYEPHCELCWIYLEQTIFVSSKGVIPNSFGDNFFHLKKAPSTKHCWWSLCERAKSGLASSRPAEIPFYTISAILQRVQLKTIAMGFSSILRYIFTSNRRIPCQNTEPHYLSTIPYFVILCTRAEGSLIQNSKSEVEGLFYLAPNHPVSSFHF